MSREAVSTLYWAEHALVDGAVQAGVVLGVADGRFRHIEAESPPGGAIRLPGLTLPGLANAHSHAFQRAIRASVQQGRGDFWSWRDLMYQTADRLDPDQMLRLGRATFAEMVLAGYTAVGEFHYLHHQPGGVPYENANAMGEALLLAARDAGLRISLLDVLYLHGGLQADGYIQAEAGQRRFGDASADAWIERVDDLEPGADQLVGAAIHSVRAADPEAMTLAADWSHRRSAPLHAHVSEQVAENEQCRSAFGKTPTELLEQHGVLDEHFTAVHFTHVSPRDVDRLARAGGGVCLCPTTERDLGDGIGPSLALEQANIRLCIGSDSHAIIDPFLEVRAVEMNARLSAQQRGLHSASSLIDIASRHGQRAIGWEDAGAIAVGQRADLVTVDLDTVRTAGARPPLEAAVFAATAPDVRCVMVDGEVIVEDGIHLRVDVARELAAVIEELFS